MSPHGPYGPLRYVGLRCVVRVLKLHCVIRVRVSEGVFGDHARNVRSVRHPMRTMQAERGAAAVKRAVAEEQERHD